MCADPEIPPHIHRDVECATADCPAVGQKVNVILTDQADGIYRTNCGFCGALNTIHPA